MGVLPGQPRSRNGNRNKNCNWAAPEMSCSGSRPLPHAGEGDLGDDESRRAAEIG
jgi:hypothetical protein